MGSGIERSKQNTLCNASYTYKKALFSIKPMQTAWANSELSSLNFIQEEYYNLIFKDTNNERLLSYFLSSRGVDLEENYANFGIFEVSLGKTIKTNSLFNTRGGSLEYWDRIRPVIEIAMDSITLDKTKDGYTPETAWKIK